MNGIYKIETYNEVNAAKIASYITQAGGRCIVQGWAVITDYSFNAASSLQLLPLISYISQNISEADYSRWQEPLTQAA